MIFKIYISIRNHHDINAALFFAAGSTSAPGSVARRTPMNFRQNSTLILTATCRPSRQTGFCQSQHERNRQEPAECRLQKESADKADFLTVHGLWPSLPKSIAARGVDNRRWMRFGCAATRPIPNLPDARQPLNHAAPKRACRWKARQNSVP